MKRKPWALGILIPAALLLSGCLNMYTPVLPLTGYGFNETSFPVQSNFHDHSVQRGRGMAKSYSLLFGAIAWGDASITAAANNGDLKTVDYMDARLLNVLTIYTEYETIVYGNH